MHLIINSRNSHLKPVILKEIDHIFLASSLYERVDTKFLRN